jgi:hypothetical protein
VLTKEAHPKTAAAKDAFGPQHILRSEPQISTDDGDGAEAVIRVILESALSAVQTVSFGLKLRRGRQTSYALIATNPQTTPERGSQRTRHTALLMTIRL